VSFEKLLTESTESNRAVFLWFLHISVLQIDCVCNQNPAPGAGSVWSCQQVRCFRLRWWRVGSEWVRGATIGVDVFPSAPPSICSWSTLPAPHLQLLELLERDGLQGQDLGLAQHLGEPALLADDQAGLGQHLRDAGRLLVVKGVCRKSELEGQGWARGAMYKLDQPPRAVVCAPAPAPGSLLPRSNEVDQQRSCPAHHPSRSKATG